MIIRSPRPESHYLTVSNSVVRDRGLSFKARGILVLLLSYPDNWSVSSERLACETPGDKGEKRDAIRTGLKELEGAGYIRRETRQDRETGRMATHTYVYDTPQPVPNPVVKSVNKGPSYPLPTTDHPAPDNPSSKELTTKNNPTKKSLGSVNRKGPDLRVCPQCDGTSWRIEQSDLVPCTCNSGTIKR